MKKEESHLIISSKVLDLILFFSNCLYREAYRRMQNAGLIGHPADHQFFMDSTSLSSYHDFDYLCNIDSFVPPTEDTSM
jgi:hypothetical protein